jgi:3D (Asp-Asp-Asp) domain-containing protein
VRVRTAIFAGLAVVLIIATDASALPSSHRHHPRRLVRNARLRMTATAYCNRGRTRSGAHAQHGVVAADPRRLPLGTRLELIAPGKPYAGTYTVKDTGSAVKGRELDIFMSSCARAKTFGRRVVEVKILRPQNRR